MNSFLLSSIGFRPDLLMHYTHVGVWDNGGDWGAKATTSQSINDAHSFRALVDYIATGN